MLVVIVRKIMLVGVALVFSLTLWACAGEDTDAVVTETNTSEGSSSAEPELVESRRVKAATNDSSPVWGFNSNIPGAVAYEGGCEGDLDQAVRGLNTVEFAVLADGVYSDCAIELTSADGQTARLLVSAFTVDTQPPAAANFTISNNQISLHSNDTSSVIYFTLDGTNPTATSQRYETPIAISNADQIRYVTVDAAGNASAVMTYIHELDDVPPSQLVAQPAGGTYTSAPSVTLSSDDPNATVYYTLDGRSPTTASPQYTAPLSITRTSILRFMAVDVAGNRSIDRREIYIVDGTAPSQLQAVPAGGEYATTQQVRLSSNDSTAFLYYTLDGSEPNQSSPVFRFPISIAANTTLRFMAVDRLGNASAVTTETYVIDSIPPTAPTASPAGGVYAGQQSVMLTSNDANDRLYYTVDGSNPTAISQRYETPIEVAQDTTLRFVAVDTVGNVSAVQRADYLIDAIAPTVTVTPDPSTYNQPVDMVLQASDNSGEPAVIYFTTDGTTATPSSTVYSQPVTISDTTNVSYMAVDSVGNQSSPVSVQYQINQPLNSPVASPAGGSFANAIRVSLANNGSDGDIFVAVDSEYYATAGFVPYSSQLTLVDDATISFYVQNQAGTKSPTELRQFVFSTPVTRDSDNDGISDQLEAEHAADPLDDADPGEGDTDQDGASNKAEIALGMNVFVPDDLGGTSEEDRWRQHVMNRLAYGASDELNQQIETAGGTDFWIQQQLFNAPRTLDNDPLQARMDAFHLADLQNVGVIATMRPIHAENQLQALMGHFWDNHFSTYINKVGSSWIELWEADQFYANSMSNFRTLLGISAKSQAMLIYLDGNENTKTAANENYSREVMELHTLGHDAGYTADDVAQLARIFTGWQALPQGLTSRYSYYQDGIRRTNLAIAEFAFQAQHHDDGTADFNQDGQPDGDKPFLMAIGGSVIASRSGQDGVLEGEEALDMLAYHPATARHVCQKLAVKFVSDNPSAQTVQDCAEVFLAARFDADQIPKVLTVLITSEEFKAAAAQRNKLKTTQEYLLSLARLLEWDADRFEGSISDGRFHNIGWRINSSNQGFYGQPAPIGWPEFSPAWNKTDTALSRIQQGNTIVHSGKAKSLMALLQDKNLTTAADILAYLLPYTTGGYYDGQDIQRAYDILHPDGGDFVMNETRLRELVSWLTVRAEFNLQ